MSRKRSRLCEKVSDGARGEVPPADEDRDRNFMQAKLQRHLQSIDERLDRYLDQMSEAEVRGPESPGTAPPHGPFFEG